MCARVCRLWAYVCASVGGVIGGGGGGGVRVRVRVCAVGGGGRKGEREDGLSYLRSSSSSSLFQSEKEVAGLFTSCLSVSHPSPSTSGKVQLRPSSSIERAVS
mmetsp:Transcript_19106/g.48890  ORF Transcript_19106/g.48890 Transcript_19106/m.48890 type:complete len:103 (-) Transcript_19106:1281-1589(-)